MSIVYFAIGVPGVGKSHFASELQELYGKENVEILSRDDNLDRSLGQNKARRILHEETSVRFRNLHLEETKILYYDSVNFSAQGRKYFYELLHPSIHRILVYWDIPRVLKNGSFENYVEALLKIRPDHPVFPLEKERAIETMKHIVSVWDELTSDERNMEVIYRAENSFLSK